MKFSLSDRILTDAPDPADYVRRKKPAWLRAPLPGGEGFARVRSLLNEHGLHTVCSSAKCPNMGECWARGTATIMILGDVCTRSCGFCHIKTGKPPVYDTDEPRRVGEMAAILRLKHIVITSVNRDELPDGGATIWAATIREIRKASPGTQVEVLIPDFCGDWDALQIVLDERPEILNHNLETVPRLYTAVRPQARYRRSLELLRRGKQQGLTVKTGIMVGIGEKDDEVLTLIDDVVEAVRVPGVAASDPETNRDPLAIPDPDRSLPYDDAWRSDPVVPLSAHPRADQLAHPAATYPGVHETCDILTIGQYLQPTKNHLPISRWVTPDAFAEYARYGKQQGLRHVESGPLVRSSYHADEQALQMA
ncbi:lipoyl synthase [Mucisphaera calidilacus]|uniref:Lipoyl synthase n=1 Tax=Mucisphaera calidilacus TaxID=2527982 RepID=A0A518BYU1_9BACT|nr:lipoyl synthase [Mucisphaera calidilacus]QDU72141.1 Lipoyl synthase [Mucisphaera calidilacus]